MINDLVLFTVQSWLAAFALSILFTRLEVTGFIFERVQFLHQIRGFLIVSDDGIVALRNPVVEKQILYS